jgi:hypothetical protein
MNINRTFTLESLSINRKYLYHKLRLLILCSTSILFLISCNIESPTDLSESGRTINLKWNKAYPDDTIEKAETGLKWGLSFLGASSIDKGIIVDNELITINLDLVGFKEAAKEKLNLLNEAIENSEEYQIHHHVDLGRYISLLIGSSEHYYAITGLAENINDLRDQYVINPSQGYINDSSVSFLNRIIEFSRQKSLNQVFIAHEVTTTEKAPEEFETIEIMENGQLRFGIFDKNGVRKSASNPINTDAGKPAKCMWCHESSIQLLLSEQNDMEGYLPQTQFRDSLLTFNSELHTKRLDLDTGIDFGQTQEHTLMELLYISFMEPNAERLRLEWNLSKGEVVNRLTGFETHSHQEFPFLGDLYDRNAIEAQAPYKGLPVSGNIREASEVEVNYIY